MNRPDDTFIVDSTVDYTDEISNVAKEIGISEENINCIDRLRELTNKHKECCNLAKKLTWCYTVPACQRQLLKNFLAQELTLADDDSERDLEARTLFGLSDIGNEVAAMDDSLLELPSWFSPMLSTVQSDDMLFVEKSEIPSPAVMAQFETLKVKTEYYKEGLSYYEMLQDYETCLRNAVQLSGDNTKELQNLALAYDKALYSISKEVQLMNLESLKIFYSEHGGEAFTATKQLLGQLKSEQEDLKRKVATLEAELDLYTQLKGTPYEDVLASYRVTLVSIWEKKWALENLQAK